MSRLALLAAFEWVNRGSLRSRKWMRLALSRSDARHLPREGNGGAGERGNKKPAARVVPNHSGLMLLAPSAMLGARGRSPALPLSSGMARSLDTKSPGKTSLARTIYGPPVHPAQGGPVDHVRPVAESSSSQRESPFPAPLPPQNGPARGEPRTRVGTRKRFLPASAASLL